MKKHKIPGQHNEPDSVTKAFFSNNDNFAEIFNKTILKEQPISPDHLQNADTTEAMVLEVKQGKRITLQQYRDVVKQLTDGSELAIMGLENQMGVNYQMPLRIMTYDCLNYTKQIMELEMQRSNANEKLSGDELLSRFKKDDKIKPVITLVIYYGDKEWDGPKKLSDMFYKMNSVFCQYIPDYPVYILDVQHMPEEQIESFEGEVKAVLGFIKYNRNKHILKKFVDSNSEQFSNISLTAAKLIESITKSDELLKYMSDERAEGGINMCQALRDMVIEAEEKGMKQGMEQGIEKGMKQGMEQGIEQGIERGKAQVMAEIIERLRQLGIDEETIKKVAMGV